MVSSLKGRRAMKWFSQHKGNEASNLAKGHMTFIKISQKPMIKQRNLFKHLYPLIISFIQIRNKHSSKRQVIPSIRQQFYEFC